MPTLHLGPVPGAQIIELPRNSPESRDAVVGQFANHLTMLVQRHGSYVGRHMFAEATATALADYSLTVDCAFDSRAALEEYFEARLDFVGKGFA